jgi:hypothetical protein
MHSILLENATRLTRRSVPFSFLLLYLLSEWAYSLLVMVNLIILTRAITNASSVDCYERLMVGLKYYPRFC